MEKTKFFFLSFGFFLLTDLHGGHHGVVVVLSQASLEPRHILAPLNEKEEKSKVDCNLDPNAEAVWKQSDTHEDDERVDDVDDCSRRDDEVKQRFLSSQLLISLFTKEEDQDRRQSVDEAVQIGIKF